MTAILDPRDDANARQRWPGLSLVVLTALGAAAGLLAASVLQPIYTASARLMVSGGGDPTVPIHVRVETERALVETPRVIARVIATEKLNADREFGQPTATEWDRQVAAWGLTSWLGRAPIGPDVASRLVDAVDVVRVGDAALFDVRVSSRDPNKAARLSNALVEAYLTERADLAVSPATAVSPEELARLAAGVREAEAALQDVRRHLGVPSDAESVETRLAKARERLADAENRVKRLESAVRAGANGVFDHDAEGGSLRELRREHVEATRRQADLLREYGPKHYRIIEINRELDRLRDQGVNEARRALDRARSEIARERETIRTLERAAPSPTQAAHPEEATLARVLQDARDAYDIALNRSRAGVSNAGLMEPITTRILSRATPPLVADQLNGSTIVGGGALAGLGLGLAIHLLRRRRPMGPAALSQDIGLPTEPVFEPLPELAAAPRVYVPAPLAPLVRQGLTGRDVVLSLGDAGPCSRAALELARQASAHGRVVLIECEGDWDGARVGLGDVLDGAARFTEALHADPVSPLHRMPPGQRAATHFQRFPLVLDALGATYDRVIVALGELPDVPELLATLDHADRVIIATDADPVIGAEAEAIAALSAVVGLGAGELHVVAAPALVERSEGRAPAWRHAG